MQGQKPKISANEISKLNLKYLKSTTIEKDMEISKQVKSARPRPPAAGMGRKKGSVNKATKVFRETVTALLENNADNVGIWLETVANGDGDQVKPDPKGALTLLAQLAEFASPKLARTEHSGVDNTPIELVVKWQDE
jgi:hypothetical protein